MDDYLTVQETPFLKQLASSDRAIRDKALSSLRSFLASDRGFTRSELLKLWRGLFFCMWHSDRPQTQQKLANSLASLVDDMRAALFGPFLSAFWTTLATNFHLIDSLRLDKFLLLMRKYVNVAFSYLDHRHWPPDLTAEYLQVIQDVLLEDQGKISDGIRYHIFDVWIDELEAADQDRKAPLKEIMGVIDKVEQRGRTKILKTKAREALADGRLSTWTMARRNGEEPEHSIDFRG